MSTTLFELRYTSPSRLDGRGFKPPYILRGGDEWGNIPLVLSTPLGQFELYFGDIKTTYWWFSGGSNEECYYISPDWTVEATIPLEFLNFEKSVDNYKPPQTLTMRQIHNRAEKYETLNLNND